MWSMHGDRLYESASGERVQLRDRFASDLVPAITP